MYAISGIAATVKSERNMRIHLAAAVAVVVLGAWLGLDGREWAAIVICCALVTVSVMCYAVVACDVSLGGYLVIDPGLRKLPVYVFVKNHIVFVPAQHV